MLVLQNKFLCKDARILLLFGVRNLFYEAHLNLKAKAKTVLISESARNCYWTSSYLESRQTLSQSFGCYGRISTEVIIRQPGPYTLLWFADSESYQCLLVIMEQNEKKFFWQFYSNRKSLWGSYYSLQISQLGCWVRPISLLARASLLHRSSRYNPLSISCQVCSSESWSPNWSWI